MFATNNFFNSTLFHVDDETQKHEVHNDFGPWYRPKQRKHATLDIQRKHQNKSEIRYNNKKYPQQSIRYSNAIQTKIVTQPLSIQLNHQSIDLKQKAHKSKNNNKIQTFLPRIQNIHKRSATKGDILSLYNNNSPLAYQLNFITKKTRRNKKLNYLPQYNNESIKSFDSIEKFLNHNQAKYNIYQKCVIQIKKTSRNKQFNKF